MPLWFTTPAEVGDGAKSAPLSGRESPFRGRVLVALAVVLKRVLFAYHYAELTSGQASTGPVIEPDPAEGGPHTLLGKRVLTAATRACYTA